MDEVMNWDVLKVVAVDMLTGGTGSGIRSPYVCDDQEHIFIVRDVDQEDPKQDLLISEDELSQRIETGLTARLPKIEAKKGYVFIVVSGAFWRSLYSVVPRNFDELSWIDIGGGHKGVYLHHDNAREWKKKTSTGVIRWIDKEYSRYYSERDSSRIVNHKDLIIQTRYICDGNIIHNRDLFIRLGLLYQETDPAKLSSVAEIASLQIPGFNVEKFGNEINGLRSSFYRPKIFNDRSARIFPAASVLKTIHSSGA